MEWLEYLKRRSQQETADRDIAGQPNRFNNGGMFNVAEFSFTGRLSVADAAKRTKLLGTLIGLPTRRGTCFSKAVTAVVERAAESGVLGTIRFGVDDVDGEQCVVAEIYLANLPGSGHETKPISCNRSQGGDYASHRLEQELEGVAELVDHVVIRLSDTASIVCLSQTLPKGAVPLADADVANWAELLEAGTPAKALAQAQRQMQRLSAEFSVKQKHGRQEPAPDRISSGAVTYELLSRVVSDTTNTIAIINRDGRVEWVNHAFEELTGYASDEASGMPFDAFLFDKESDPKWVSRMRRMLAEGKAISGERIHHRRGGKQYCCTFNISPLHEPDGKLAGWVDIGWDTTTARKARDELERARQNAVVANRAKSEFLANMSHEIRTPMNTILGMTELAMGTEQPQQLAEYLRAVKDSAKSLLEILNDILDLSKIEARRLALEEIDFNLANLLHETMRPLVLESDKKGIKLAWYLPQDVPKDLRGDPTRLRQVLLNLVSNAIKFTAQGAVEVSVERQWSGGSEVGLQLSVRDTGVGIPPDRLSTIFEAFTQVDSSTTRQFGGTGLGLTITAELLRLMNGRIWVESEVGKGSTFYCTVRLRKAEQPVRSQPISADDEYLEGHHARRLNILIADDHHPNRQLVAEILRKYGHTFKEAASGDEVLKSLEHEKFDVVLMDVQMPEMDGFETTIRIRTAERETHTHQPIVAVTAYAMKGDHEKCLTAGMDAYLAKPIDSKELIRLIETLAAATPDTDITPLMPGKSALDGVTHHKLLDKESVPIDFGPALERLAGDIDLLKRQMSFFLDEAPKLVEQLHASLTATDAAHMKLTAHRLKGLVSSYDQHDAAQIAEQLERCALENRLDEAPALATSLSQHVHELSAAIRNYIT